MIVPPPKHNSMEPSNLTTKFTEDLAQITWSDIKPHAQRDAVIVIDRAINIVDVAVAIASDHKDKVQHWIDEALVQKPSTEQLSIWNEDPAMIFTALIVQPYVLISALTNAPTESL
jgi:hypothetical protein